MVLKKDVRGEYGHRGKYVLLSRTEPKKVLKIFGEYKPTQEEVQAEEARIQMFKHMSNPGYTTVKSHNRRTKHTTAKVRKHPRRYGTIKRGKVKFKLGSKQHKFLLAKELPFSVVTEINGKKIKRFNT